MAMAEWEKEGRETTKKEKKKTRKGG